MSIRISKQMEDRAEAAARSSFRSVAKQVEFWASVGEAACRDLSESEVHGLLEGDLRVVVVASQSALSTGEILGRVATLRDSGELARRVTSAGTRVEADPDRPGGVRIIEADGSVLRGDWRDGGFVPLEERTAAR